jgi:type IV pilus assembly protein PilX
MNSMHTSTPSSQTGAALITGLIFLVVLTLITLSATKSTSLEERMAGNARDQDVAFQAAEAAIREGVKVASTLTPASFGPGCAAGLCSNDPVTPVWTTVTWLSGQTSQLSGAALTFGPQPLANKPRYIIELLQGIAPPGEPVGSVYSYRITARGWGLTDQTRTTLQAAIIF